MKMSVFFVFFFKIKKKLVKEKKMKKNVEKKHRPKKTLKFRTLTVSEENLDKSPTYNNFS